jgi:hypothetical protein
LQVLVASAKRCLHQQLEKGRPCRPFLLTDPKLAREPDAAVAASMWLFGDGISGVARL